MPTYRVTSVNATDWTEEIEADSVEDAIDLAVGGGYLCYQCAGERNDGEWEPVLVYDGERDEELWDREKEYVRVDRDVWERAQKLFREQDRGHAWMHYCALSNVRCPGCGLRHGERDDYSCAEHSPHEYDPDELAEALRCGQDCPPWSQFHDRASTFPFSEFDAAR